MDKRIYQLSSIILGSVLLIQGAGKLLDASHLEVLFGRFDVTGVAGPALVGLLTIDLVLIGLLASPRSRGIGLFASAAFFALVAATLVLMDLHTADAACRGLYLWNGTGSGPAAVVRAGSLAGLALLGATSRKR